MIVPFVLSVSREVLLRWRATKGKQPWHWVRQMGIHLESGRAAARIGIFDRCFWRWRAHWARQWQLPWSSATIQDSASLFSPGYSIAAVLANEFSEATGNLYLSALIELDWFCFY